MTRAHGSRRRLSATCSRYCSSASRPGVYSGFVTDATSAATRGPNSSASAASAAARVPSGASSAAWSSTASCSRAAQTTSASRTP